MLISINVLDLLLLPSIFTKIFFFYKYIIFLGKIHDILEFNGTELQIHTTQFFKSLYPF